MSETLCQIVYIIGIVMGYSIIGAFTAGILTKEKINLTDYTQW